MSSKSTLYCLSTIAIAAGAAKMIEEQADTHFCKERATFLLDASQRAIANWPEVKLNASELKEIEKQYIVLENTNFFTSGNQEQVLTLISMVSTNLVQINKKINNTKKKELIAEVISALSKLHHYFSPAQETEKELELYQKGENYAEFWRNTKDNS